ncbi:MAG: hypothetical protein AB1635_14290 [Acidobacteriota bacterium]
MSRRPPSNARALAGALIFLVALTVVALGFQGLFRAIGAHGHGSPEVRLMLVQLGVGGALLATGISLLIWEASVRFERRGPKT